MRSKFESTPAVLVVAVKVKAQIIAKIVVNHKVKAQIIAKIVVNHKVKAQIIAKIVVNPKIIAKNVVNPRPIYFFSRYLRFSIDWAAVLGKVYCV